LAHRQGCLLSAPDPSRRSRALLKQAAKFVPGGVNTSRRKIEPPVCIRRGHGATIEDVDGRRFLDYHAAYGPILLGHSYPPVVERVSNAIRETVLFGVGTTETEVALASKIVNHVPSIEEVLLCNSGSEATYHAVRLARAVTGRQRLLKFEGCYHGFHDSVLIGSDEGATVVRDEKPARSQSTVVRKADLFSAGMLEPAVGTTIVCRYNDLQGVDDAMGAHEGEIAAVIIEPISHNGPGVMPKPGFLEGLRQLCDREGTLLIFDEVITGFRHALGGYQSLAQVTPDITTLGKAMGNGFPIAAVGGRRDLMERFNTSPHGDVFYAGTFAGNAVAATAALTTIEILETEPVHKHIFRLGKRMRAGLTEIAQVLDVPATAGGFGSVFHFIFAEGPIESYEDVRRNDVDLFLEYRRQLIARGIFEMSDVDGMRSHVSYSHTDADIDRTLEISAQSLRAALARRGSPSIR
jgi:glutamate-1-semialdehyde 2,1-aminomutase